MIHDNGEANSSENSINKLVEILFGPLQHSQEFHDNNYFTTKISIIARCFGEPITRMITEAVHINQLSNEDTLNSKIESTYIKLPSATIR